MARGHYYGGSHTRGGQTEPTRKSRGISKKSYLTYLREKKSQAWSDYEKCYEAFRKAQTERNGRMIDFYATAMYRHRKTIGNLELAIANEERREAMEAI